MAFSSLALDSFRSFILLLVAMPGLIDTLLLEGSYYDCL